jgi:hypothetical protein
MTKKRSRRSRKTESRERKRGKVKARERRASHRRRRHTSKMRPTPASRGGSRRSS